ncbi:MAG: serine/threonine-protein kinase [Bacilli bacterium]
MLLFDKYLVLDLLSNKEETKIYLVDNVLNNNQYIIKALYKNVLKDYMQKQYYKEIDLLGKVRHSRIPKIHEVINVNDWIYIVIDYIKGVSLERYALEENVNEEEALTLFKSLIDIVDYLHTSLDRPVIHRDIKPSNVLCYNHDLYLIDFGNVRYYDQSKNKDTIKLGTKGFAAPEQYDDASQTDERTDIYGMGITMYYLLTKHNPAEPPYEIYPIRYFNKEYSEDLEKIITKCIKLNPNERYQNCSDLLNDIKLLVRSEK